MVLTRRMAKLQSASHGDSNASDNAVAITGSGPAQVRTAVCEDAVREAAVLPPPYHGNGNEGSGALKSNIPTEDESTSTGPRSLVSYNAENTEGIITYKGHWKASGKAQPLAGASATQANGHCLELSRMQTVSARNIYHDEHHSSSLSPVPPSPTAPRQSDAAKKPRKRKGTRTRWTRTKKQKANAKAKGTANEPTRSTENVAIPIEQRVPVQERTTKRLPRRAAKTAAIIEAVRKAETTVRKGKWKANPNELPTTREAQVGCKRARNESTFSVGDNFYPRVDPGPSRTTRRVRQRTVAPPVPESPAPVEESSARRLRRRRVSVPVQPLTARTKKRRASALEHTDEDKTAKRRKMEHASPPRPRASDFVAIKSERPPYIEPSAFPLRQIKREQSTPPLEQSQQSSSSSVARRRLHDAWPTPSYPDVGEEEDEMRDVEDALDIDDADYSQVDLRQVLARLSRRLHEEESLPPRMTWNPAEVGIRASNSDDRSISPPATRVLSRTRHRQEMLIGVFEQLPLGLPSQSNDADIPTSSVVHAPPPIQHQPPAPLRPEPRVDVRRFARTFTPAPCPEWFATTTESSREMSRASSSESSFPSTPTSSPPRFALMSSPRSGSRSLTRSPSPPRERERSMAPEPSDELIEALRAGRVSMCPSPSPTECDTEE